MALPAAASPSQRFVNKALPEIPADDSKPAARWIPSFSMPSLSFTHGVVNASVYGAVASMAMNYLAPAYAVSVLTGTVACGSAKLAQNMLADKVSIAANRAISILIGSAVATAVVCFSAFTACTLSALSVPLSLFGLTAVTASVSHAMQMVGSVRL